tara:strand:- start:15753 stop:17801 length:2049 start_codon:yes stop_codon:yes gene_type:complete
MAAIPQSPAVVFLEKDNSSYPPNIESSIVGIVGYASKGPTNKATLITSQENLVRTFGKPNEGLTGQGLEGAIEILETTNQVEFVRAIPSDALYASSVVQYGIAPSVQLAASGYGITNNLYLQISVSDSNGTAILTNKQYSIPSGTLGTSYSQASAIAKIIGDGTNQNDSVSLIYSDSTSSTGYLVAAWAGPLARLAVSAYSGTAFTQAVFAPSSLFAVDYNGNSVTAAASSFVSGGAAIVTSSLSYLVRSQYPGAGYNLGQDINTGQTSGISVEAASIGGANTNLSINMDGVAEETFTMSLLNDKTFAETVINTGITNKKSNIIMGELYLSGGLNVVTPAPLSNFSNQVTSLGVNNVTLVSPAVTATPRFVKPIAATYNAAGGTNGTMDTSTSLIGTSTAKTGIYALDDDALNISMAIVPGVSNQAVDNALITLAETSQNFIAVVSPPVGLATVEQATDWMNGRGNGRTAAVNSSWAAVVWPWVQVFDVFDSKDRWYDPSIFAIRQMAFTDNVAETWFAPAGFRRGRLTKPTATELPLNQGDRDALYTNSINPIVNFNPEGITIFGQKTAQRSASALDRINVRRLMIYLRKVLLLTGRQDLFEPNDKFTWELIKDKAESLLSDIQARRGVVDYRVICDETTNTPVRVDRNELWCKILIKPTKTAEWIVFEVNLTSQSAKFNG